jgi:micrococcal nuclease
MTDQVYYYQAKVIKVIDGDTVEVEIDLGFGISKKFKARLWGINTPEISKSRSKEEKAKGLESKARLEQWLKDNSTDNKILIKSHDGKQLKQEKYGRWLIEIYPTNKNINSISLNDLLVKEGYAVEFMRK